MRTALARALIKQSIQDELVYPARNIIWSLLSVFWVCVLPVVWLAIYDERSSIAGFDRTAIVTYFIGLLIIEYVVEFWIDDDLHYQIRDGQFSQLLLKPVNWVRYVYFEHLGFRVTRLVFFGAVAVVAAVFFPAMFALPTQWSTVALVFAFLAIGHLISFNIKLMLACLAFWFEEASPFSTIYWVVTMMPKGWVGPLVFFPLWFQQISEWLPWQYTMYAPLMVYLEIPDWSTVSRWLLFGFGWVVALTLLRMVVVRRSVRHYNAVGA